MYSCLKQTSPFCDPQLNEVRAADFFGHTSEMLTLHSQRKPQRAVLEARSFEENFFCALWLAPRIFYQEQAYRSLLFGAGLCLRLAVGLHVLLLRFLRASKLTDSAQG